jgi:hypothetical protein
LTPFFTGSACVTCEEPTPIFDISLAECSDCPEGLKYDDKSKNCVDKIALQPNPVAKDRVLVNPLGPDGQLDDYMNQEGELCPEDKPFVQGGECISCPEETPSFAIEIEECVKAVRPSNSVRDKVVLGDDEPEEDLDKYMDQTGEECPEETPFVQAYKCIACPEDESYFNLEDQECMPGLKKPNQNARDLIVLGTNQTEADLDSYMDQNGD